MNLQESAALVSLGSNEWANPGECGGDARLLLVGQVSVPLVGQVHPIRADEHAIVVDEPLVGEGIDENRTAAAASACSASRSPVTLLGGFSLSTTARPG